MNCTGADPGQVRFSNISVFHQSVLGREACGCICGGKTSALRAPATLIGSP